MAKAATLGTRGNNQTRDFEGTNVWDGKGRRDHEGSTGRAKKKKTLRTLRPERGENPAGYPGVQSL